jgi:hypothetical protein
MPVLKLGKWPKKTEPLAYHLLLATMVFPDDEIKRKQYIAAQTLSLKTDIFDYRMETNVKKPYSDTLKSLTESAESDYQLRIEIAKKKIQSIYESIDGEKTILDTPRYDSVMIEFAKDFREGLVSGEILVLIKQISDDRVKIKSSKRKAIELLVKLRAKSLKESGLKAANRASFEKLWSKFKIVSHLWASFYVFTENNFPSEYNPETDQGLVGFLNVAKQFQEFLTTFVSPAGQFSEPLSTKNKIWSLPKSLPISTLKISLPPLSREQLEVLTTYQAPQ